MPTFDLVFKPTFLDQLLNSLIPFLTFCDNLEISYKLARQACIKVREGVAITCSFPLYDLERTEAFVIDFQQLNRSVCGKESRQRPGKLCARRHVHEAIVCVHLCLFELPVGRNWYWCALVSRSIVENLINVVGKRARCRHSRKKPDMSVMRKPDFYQ